MLKRVNTVLLCLLIFFICITTAAQEGPYTFEFNFSNPGARSLGLGGAFSALADDATAAVANPAGIVQLIEQEVSFELGYWSYDISYIEGGRVSGNPTNIGLDTLDGLRYGTSNYTTTGLSFISYVYPSDNWSIALYRHTWADFTLNRKIHGLFGDIDGEVERSEDILAETRFQVVNNGVAGAFRIGEHFKIGIGFVYFESELEYHAEEYVVDDENFFEPNTFEYEYLDTSYYHRGESTGVTFHGGILWNPTANWSVGAFYRQGPEMTIRVTEVTGPANDDEPEGTVEIDTRTAFQLPDQYGCGIAYRTLEGLLTISFEWDHVNYSSITEGLDTLVYDPDQASIPDADEYHLGLEYVTITTKPAIAMRMGSYYDPAHGLKFGIDSELFEETIFNGGEDQFHYTFSLGLVFSKMQLDIGADLAKTVDHLSFSIVYRF